MECFTIFIDDNWKISGRLMDSENTGWLQPNILYNHNVCSLIPHGKICCCYFNNNDNNYILI